LTILVNISDKNCLSLISIAVLDTPLYRQESVPRLGLGFAPDWINIYPAGRGLQPEIMGIPLQAQWVIAHSAEAMHLFAGLGVCLWGKI
jgi:hypothetical protein